MKTKGREANAPRRRCCECRRWYTPEPSAAKTQMTCGRKCRLLRRAKQEKARREADLSNARAADRVRQREHRERLRKAAAAGLKTMAAGPKVAAAEPVSRAGLSAQAVEAIGEIVEKVRQAQRLSQAGLHRQVRRVVLGELRRLDLSSSVET